MEFDQFLRLLKALENEAVEKDTLRPQDRADAALLRERFGLKED